MDSFFIISNVVFKKFDHFLPVSPIIAPFNGITWPHLNYNFTALIGLKI